jgi:uncharacterized RDD family membrane protein YckC
MKPGLKQPGFLFVFHLNIAFRLFFSDSVETAYYANSETMENLDPVIPAETAPANYAGFWYRLGAFLIDAIILSVISYVIALLMGESLNTAPTDTTVEMTEPTRYYSTFNIISAVINWLYFTLQESSPNQATLGKRALGLYVTDLKGQRINFLKATVRHFCKVISAITLLIGFIMIAFTERKQGLHDLIAGTLVLKNR